MAYGGLGLIHVLNSKIGVVWATLGAFRYLALKLNVSSLTMTILLFNDV